MELYSLELKFSKCFDPKTIPVRGKSRSTDITQPCTRPPKCPQVTEKGGFYKVSGRENSNKGWLHRKHIQLGILRMGFYAKFSPKTYKKLKKPFNTTKLQFPKYIMIGGDEIISNTTFSYKNPFIITYDHF